MEPQGLWHSSTFSPYSEEGNDGGKRGSSTGRREQAGLHCGAFGMISDHALRAIELGVAYAHTNKHVQPDTFPLRKEPDMEEYAS